MRKTLLLILLIAIAGAYIYVLQRPWGSIPALGNLLDPVNGVYHLSRNSMPQEQLDLNIGVLNAPVQIVRDERGVPHIFAENSLDAVTALGFAVAQDRLFQLDFIPRVASGRLSEILGPTMIDTDRFLRETGMDWGAQKNVERMEKEGGVELEIIRAYVAGVNAYINTMEEGDLPLEFRLLGYEPELYTEMHVIRILQYMTYDLTFRSSDPVYNALASALGSEKFEELFPEYASLYVPIIPEKGGRIFEQDKRPVFEADRSLGKEGPAAHAFPTEIAHQQASFIGSVNEGFIDGKGSNNWVVGPDRSETGSAILAGDMHLSLWLPSIWYETHFVTPDMNTYGVTIPGAPLPVEAFNDYLGWAFTNTGSDQIDYISLTINDTGDKYLDKGEWRNLIAVKDTIRVKGENPIVDTRYFSHWGPTQVNDDEGIAIQWVAHNTSRTMLAQWKMNQARSFSAFQEALTYWDTPMQNIIYGDISGNIAIRATGVLPVRKGRHGIGLVNASSGGGEWIGQVPFDELPYSFNPEEGYLTSTNQQPADSTYPYYQGYDWGPGYRSLRIDALLEGKEKHTLEDIMRYQSDVYVVQRDLFVPLLEGLVDISDRAKEIRALLQNWEGESAVDRIEPLVFDMFLDNLNEVVWDEQVFIDQRSPKEDKLYEILTGVISDEWLDIQSTSDVEDASGVMKYALEKTVADISDQFGWEKSAWRWGDHHKIIFKHYTRAEALRSLWRGPFEYPGFANTLSPASNRETTHSASWRVVVDFSTPKPTGYGVYPGGQSGNPFSVNYDSHIEKYLAFEYFELLKPETIEDMEDGQISSRITLSPF